jgi:magnesium-transporting ATPase (P-type)
LSANDARERLRRDGANRLTPPKRRGPLVRFLRQFDNVLIYVLLASSAVTAGLGQVIDTAVILGVLVVNALAGFIQEGKAERSLNAIRRMLSQSALVVRDGRRQQVAAESLVCGDIVLLSPGDKVPADLRLTASRTLRIEEAALTGESTAVDKETALVPADVAVGDRSCMAHSGTLVVFGQGRGIVVATGDRTEIGRIGRLLATVEAVETPLLRQMAVFGRWLTAAILALAAFTLLFGTAVHGLPVGEMFVAAVGLAVAAIPEGLPAIMTITLAIGVRRMALRRAIIRRMPAVETLGAVTTICTDKTGTLTRNEMTVQRLMTAGDCVDVTGIGYSPRGGFCRNGVDIELSPGGELEEVARGAVLCTDASLRRVTGNAADPEWRVDGDPTEGALLAMAMKAGLDPVLVSEEFPRVDAIPFESSHQFMATLHHDHQGHAFVFVKGAPERVIERCASQRREGVDELLDLAFWHEAVEQLAANGFRVLALAMRTLPAGTTEIGFADVDKGMTLLGLTGLIDPPRDEAVQAVAQCQSAGIRVKMITGDHAVTATAIARAMGMRCQGGVLTGREIEQMSAPALEAAVAEADLFARASPEHKLRIVEALQSRREVVAMTGDGVNDAPALKRADVGVAMGEKGTEAAKEAAEMVLADDNFASIVAAIEEGRTVFENLRKAIAFILPTNGGEAAVLVIAILLGITLPITPVQILWVNMVTAVTLALALAFERPESDLMARAPRPPQEPLIDTFLVWRISLVSVLLVLISLGLFEWVAAAGHSVDVARTTAVNGLVVAEMFYLINCRNLEASVLSREGLTGNPRVLQAIAALALLQALFTYAPPMQRLFGTAPIAVAVWLAILLVGLALMLVVEGEKWLWRRCRSGRAVPPSVPT